MWRHSVLIAAAVLSATPALAARRFNSATPAFPIEHQVASAIADKDQQGPYAMNYADEAAQSLGVSHGRWDAFDTGTSSSNPFMPALKGGVDGGGAMIRLQWR